MNFIKNKIRPLILVFKYIENPVGAILSRLYIIKEYECKIKGNNETILIKKEEQPPKLNTLLTSINQSYIFTGKFDINTFKNAWNYFNKEIIIIDNTKYYNKGEWVLSQIAESFLGNVYHVDKTPDSHVIVDVGANFADSTLYFASRGYKVIAFEPLSEIYNLAKENIDLNPHLKDNVTLVKKAVSDKRGKLTIHYNSIEESGGASSFTSGTKFQEEVDVTTIPDIIEEHNIINPYLLKMDCEGAESDIILNTDLSMFEKIYLEYHTMNNNVKWQVLVDKLEKDGFRLDKRMGNNDIGILHLSRK